MMAKLSELQLWFLMNLVLLMYHQNVVSQPVSTSERVNAFYYLEHFGYVYNDELTPRSALMGDEKMAESIKRFQVCTYLLLDLLFIELKILATFLQTFAGLEPTGELDDRTIELIHTPRCGVTDVLDVKNTVKKRKKRYARQGSRWSKSKLTWRITTYPGSDDLKKSDIDREMKLGFEMWSNHTLLEFEQRKEGNADIYIQFRKSKHGDGDPFDGKGGTLAHAFFPKFGGQVHFDDDETFTINSIAGTNLLQTAAHEFGHSLGLSHSDVKESLMAPFYKPYNPNLVLHADDIEGIQALYGVLEQEIVNEESSSSSPVNPDELDNAALCDGGSIDDIFGTDDGSFYVFKGSQYWKLSDTSVEPGYPRKIADDWLGLPNEIGM